jgi:hypothetical protein
LKHWWPEHVYRSKPYVALGLGTVLALGSIVVSIVRGYWGLWALACGTGCAILIYGAIILQLRREYRQRSKWARHDAQQSKERQR